MGRAGQPAYHRGQVEWGLPAKFQDDGSKEKNLGATWNKILPAKPTPRSNFCLRASAQFFTLQGMSNGVTMQGTPGANIWGSPYCLVSRPGEMRSPLQISGACGSGWGQPDRRTYTLSSLCLRLPLLTVLKISNIKLKSQAIWNYEWFDERTIILKGTCWFYRTCLGKNVFNQTCFKAKK